MIIRQSGDSQLFITQPDHAGLAAIIMAAWRVDGFEMHSRRDLILRAVRDHDNGWIEEDATTIIDGGGRPLDFMSAPVEVKHRIWPRAVARVGLRDRDEAALIAQHALTVHAQHRADEMWRPFFDGLEAARTGMLGRPADDEFEREYRFVQIGDLLSLVFCNGWTEPHDLPGGGRTTLEGATLEVSPDPFAGAQVPLRVTARRLAARTYASACELRAALESAPLETLEGWAVGAAERPAGARTAR
jgi:Protein of unknown function (DUF3891)